MVRNCTNVLDNIHDTLLVAEVMKLTDKWQGRFQGRLADQLSSHLI